jgi:hypothetical protein
MGSDTVIAPVITKKELHMRRGFAVTALVFGSASLLAGCAGSHQEGNAPQHSVSESGGHVMGCQLCYDETKSSERYGKNSAAYPGVHIIHTHKCEGCKADVTNYTEDGKPMIKCPKCAPDGVACDKCLPPK